MQFDDGSVYSINDLIALALSTVNPSNHSPIANDTIVGLQATQDQVFRHVLPTNMFSDPDGDALTFSVTLADGSALPSWLTFNAATRTLSGTPANGDVGNLSLKVIATDPKGLSASQTFALGVENVNDTPESIGSFAEQAAEQGQLWSFVIPQVPSAILMVMR